MRGMFAMLYVVPERNDFRFNDDGEPSNEVNQYRQIIKEI